MFPLPSLCISKWLLIQVNELGKGLEYTAQCLWGQGPGINAAAHTSCGNSWSPMLLVRTLNWLWSISESITSGRPGVPLMLPEPPPSLLGHSAVLQSFVFACVFLASSLKVSSGDYLDLYSGASELFVVLTLHKCNFIIKSDEINQMRSPKAVISSWYCLVSEVAISIWATTVLSCPPWDFSGDNSGHLILLELKEDLLWRNMIGT